MSSLAESYAMRSLDIPEPYPYIPVLSEGDAAYHRSSAGVKEPSDLRADWLVASESEIRFVGRTIINAMQSPEPWMDWGVDMERTHYSDYHQLANVLVFYGDAVLLQKRATEPFAGRWSIPGGGKLLDDASYYDAARRELIEESDIDPGNQLQRQYVYVDHRYRLESHVYKFMSPTDYFVNVEPPEHSEMGFRPIPWALERDLAPGLRIALRSRIEV